MYETPSCYPAGCTAADIDKQGETLASWAIAEAEEQRVRDADAFFEWLDERSKTVRQHVEFSIDNDFLMLNALSDPTCDYSTGEAFVIMMSSANPKVITMARNFLRKQYIDSSSQKINELASMIMDEVQS